MYDDKILNNKKYNVLNETDYEFKITPPTGLKLKDPVLVFNINNEWMIVPLRVMLSYPIIHISNKQQIDNDTFNKHILSLVFCPLTMQTTVLVGKFSFKEYINGKMILVDQNNSILPINIGHGISEDNVIESIPRIAVKIQTLRNSVVNSPDAKYLYCKKEFNSSIIDTNFYHDKTYAYSDYKYALETKIHPKTLVYVIRYKQKDKIKYKIIIGKDANSNTVTGFDTKKSGYDDYLAHNADRLIDKEAYIMPILLYSVNIIYADKKIKYVYIE